MRTILLAALVVVGLSASNLARAEIIRCFASVPYGNIEEVHRYDIVLPDEMESFLGVTDADGRHVTTLSKTGVGLIEVKRVRSLHAAERFEFMLLKKPSQQTPLVGIYFTDMFYGAPVIVQANLWDGAPEPKRFLVFGNNVLDQLGKGHCEE